VLEIDVDVGRLAAVGGDEALEQQVDALGIDLGDAETEAHRRIGRRAAPLAQNLFLAGEADDVVDGEEVGRVLQLGNQLELAVETLPHLVGNAAGITAGGADESEMDERILRRGETLDILVGIFVFELVEREGKLLAQPQGFVERLRRVAKQPCHLFRRLEIALGIGGQQPAGVLQSRVLADAGEHVGELAPVGMMIEHVIDGDQRQALVACQRQALGEPRAVIAAIEHRRG
jgi:hypothetical protein